MPQQDGPDITIRHVAAGQQALPLTGRAQRTAQPDGQVGNPGCPRERDQAPVDVDRAGRVSVDLQYARGPAGGQAVQDSGDLPPRKPV